MRAMVVTAELSPVTNVGGLGESVAGLVGALRAAGTDVDVVLPDYTPARTPLGGETTRRIAVPGWAAPATVRIGEHATTGPVQLVTVPRIGRSHPYLVPDGSPWPDNAARFLAFSRAVAAMVRARPPDVLHLHDWHAGAALAALPAPPPTVLTVHNVAYQGVTDGSWLARIGPRARPYEWWGGTNPLAGGIALADRVVTASARYGVEIRTPTGGCGLQMVLRDRTAAMTAIRHGIDTVRWDPAADRHLAVRFGGGERALLAARRRNRAAALARLGWPDDDRPLAMLVGRLTAPKGVDMLCPVVPALRHVPMRLVVLGLGDVELVRTLAGLSADHRDTFALVERFDEPLAHLLLGGGDLALAPSRVDPYGLAPMQAMRYGAIPVVTPVGGLFDVVADVDEDPNGTGVVADGVEPVGLMAALFRAARLLADRRRHQPLVRRIMALDWSWHDPAARYQALYEQLVTEHGRPDASLRESRPAEPEPQ